MLESRRNRILGKIQTMSEMEFTKSVLIPLFEAMAYRVDYHGGANERGKDLICFKEGEFGDQEITAVQVKKTRPTAVASDVKNSFSEIVTQLQQASEENIPLLNGTLQRPNRVYFITPFEIDVRALESRFGGLQHLSLRNVRVLDGANVVDSLQKKLPKLADSLCGDDYMLQAGALLNLSNQDLLSALNFSVEKDIVDFYCDLDFSVGRVTSKLFFSLGFAPNVLSSGASPLRWTAIKSAANQFASTSGTEILLPKIEEIEASYEARRVRWESEENKALIKRIWQLVNDIEGLFKFILDEAGSIVDATFWLNANQIGFPKLSRELTDEEASRLSELSKAREQLNKDYGGWFERSDISDGTIAKMKALVGNGERYITSLRTNTVVINATEAGTLKRLLTNMAQLNKLFKALEETFSRRTDEPVYEFSINGSAIADALLNYRKYVSDGADKLSNGGIARDEIRAYFTECQQIFSLVELVLSERLFSEAVGLDTSQRFAISSGRRIHLPVKEVFATGIHCAVYGEAGAGKSTTLHRYASAAIAQDREDEVTLWIPLTRALTIEKWDDDLPPIQRLEHTLASFFSSAGTIRQDDVVPLLLSKRRVVFIFDGVDEVVKRAPWISAAIHDLPNRFPSCQIIVSARSTGTYPELSSFLGLTLLPFTPEQVEFFVRGWFIESPAVADSVVSHLRSVPAVADIARNPLLATVLCVLASNDVPLPRGELAMYAERMNLLLGHYDIHKKTKRLDSHHTLLRTVARQIALGLHKDNLRSAPLDVLQQIANKAMAQINSRPSREKVNLAVVELVDPCNILVPMTNEGGFGFGHLRYQEYLCAEELHHNRSIDLLPLLSSPWWRSVIVFFCRLHGSVEFLINDVIGKEHTVEKYFDTLMAVLATQSKDEQKRLRPLITSHQRMDILSADMRELAEYSEQDDDLFELGMDMPSRSHLNSY